MIQFRSDDRQDEVAAPRPQDSHIWKTAAAVILGILVIIGLLAVVFPSQFKHQFEISFLRQPQPYTQLFFSDPAALPTKLKVDQENKFSFTVTNDQAKSESYQYVVALTYGKNQKVAARGSLNVGNNQSATQIVKFKPTSRKSRYLIKITLSGTDDVIQFYGETS